MRACGMKFNDRGIPRKHIPRRKVPSTRLKQIRNDSQFRFQPTDVAIADLQPAGSFDPRDLLLPYLV